MRGYGVVARWFSRVLLSAIAVGCSIAGLRLLWLLSDETHLDSDTPATRSRHPALYPRSQGEAGFVSVYTNEGSSKRRSASLEYRGQVAPATDKRPTTNRSSQYNSAGLLEKSCRSVQYLQRMSPWQRKILLRHMLYDDKNKLIFCSIPKSGSSSWKRVLLALMAEGKIPADRFRDLYSLPTGISLKYIHQLPRTAIEYRLKSYYKFMFVRNPVDRIAAVYSHKFTDFPESMMFKRKFGPVILKDWKEDEYADVEERDLVEEAAFEQRNISFEAFVEYLIRTKLQVLNEHWMPAYQLCQPCAVRYDFIGRFEDLPNSADAMLEELNLQKLVRFPNQTLHYRSPPFPHDDAVAMMNSLTPRVRHQLYSLYGYDFGLFSYTYPNHK